MFFFVKAGNQTLTFELDPADTVALVKRRVEASRGIPVACQRLVFGGAQLKDHRTLGTCGVQRDSTIEVLGRLLGSGTKHKRKKAPGGSEPKSKRARVKDDSDEKAPPPSKTGGACLHWFRKGLRLDDNEALRACLAKGAARVYPVYVMDGDCYQLRHCSALRANFLVECLQDLDSSLRKAGSRLYVASGDPVEVLPTLWAKWGITDMTYERNETGEPYARKRDIAVLKAARKHGVQTEGFAQETLNPLERYVGLSSGNAPKSYSSFVKLLGRCGTPKKPLDAPTNFPHLKDDCKEMHPPRAPTDLPWPRDTPKSKVWPIWDASDCKGLTPMVEGGETAALARLAQKAKNSSWVASFEKPKTKPASIKETTTILSPYLAIGALSPRRFWHSIADAIKKAPASVKRSKPPTSLHGQIIWREFNHLIAHSANEAKRGSWSQMQGNIYCRQIPWGDDQKMLDAWRDAKTGFPWIDACMTQLRTEGWMHHLGRHAVACFLTRGDLWQSWEKGAAHFESQLLDADYSLNNFNWLWLSCSGFFYQYFRCYSPISFQKKNDPDGKYIRKYLPALKKMPSKYIFEPWTAPKSVQELSGCIIGKDYPKPIVDHKVVSKANMGKVAEAYKAYKKKK